VTPAGTCQRRLFKEPVGNFAWCPPADCGYPGDRQEVLDDSMGRFRVGALEGGKEPESDGPAVIVSAARSRHAVDGCHQLVGFSEEITQPPLPHARQTKFGQNGREQCFVTDADVCLFNAECLQRAYGKCKQIRICFRNIRTSQAFRTQLRNFAEPVRALAENRPVVAIGGREL